MAASIKNLGPSLQDASKKQVTEESKGLPDFQIDLLGEKNLGYGSRCQTRQTCPNSGDIDDPKKPGESADKSQRSTKDSAKKQIETQGEETKKKLKLTFSL